MQNVKRNSTLEEVIAYIQGNVSVKNGVAYWAKSRGMMCRAGVPIKGDVVSVFYRLYPKREIIGFLTGEIEYYLAEEVSRDDYKAARAEIERKEKALRGDKVADRKEAAASLVENVAIIKDIVTELIESGPTHKQLQQIIDMLQSMDDRLAKLESSTK